MPNQITEAEVRAAATTLNLNLTDAQVQQYVTDQKLPEAPSPQQREETMAISKVNELIDKAKKQAAQTERQKLYEDMEKLKKDAKAAQDNLQTASQELEKLRQSPPTDASARELQERDGKIATLTTQIEVLTRTFQDQIKSQEQQRLTKDLADHRAKIIADATQNGVAEIVEALVTGNTIEELDVAAVKAKAEYARLRTEAEARVRKSMNLAPAPGSQIPGPQQQPAQPLQPSQPENMTDEQRRAAAEEEIAKRIAAFKKDGDPAKWKEQRLTVIGEVYKKFNIPIPGQ